MTSVEAGIGGWRDTLWRYAESVRHGWREYLAENPPGILAVTLVPRAVLQTAFFTLLGGILAGPEHRTHVFVGVVALMLCLTGAVTVADVVMVDKWSATFWRLRTSRPGPATVFFARAVPYAVVGLGLAVVSAVVVAPLTGQLGTLAGLLPVAWVFALMAVTVTAAGLAVASLAVGRRADVLAGNLLSYVIMATSGALLAPDRFPVLDLVGTVLPVRHGLAAVRAALDGQPYLGAVAAEALVGLGWAALAFVLFSLQTRRARRHGHDDFD